MSITCFSEERCVMCGQLIEEGRQVCARCDRKIAEGKQKPDCRKEHCAKRQSNLLGSLLNKFKNN